jgi:hypothetical protein
MNRTKKTWWIPKIPQELTKNLGASPMFSDQKTTTNDLLTTWPSVEVSHRRSWGQNLGFCPSLGGKASMIQWEFLGWLLIVVNG